MVAIHDSGMTRMISGVGVTPSTTDSATAMLSSRRPSSISRSPTNELLVMRCWEVGEREGGRGVVLLFVPLFFHHASQSVDACGGECSSGRKIKGRSSILDP